MGFPVDVVVALLFDLFAQPVWVQLWVVWTVAVIVATPVIMRMYGAARRDHLIVAATTVALLVAMPLWHDHVGYVRLLGLPHILVWTPLAVYLHSRRRHLSSPWQVRRAVNVLMLTIVVSLAFDCVDAVRYMLGERAPLNLPASG